MEPISKQLPGVKEVALFGKGLHVVAEDAEAAVKVFEVRRLLAEQGFRSVGSRKSSPRWRTCSSR